ncbi:hypothetical protein B0A48_07110 [Cryoendolithus antarcticus]|uniref:Uncharacterized protein n=1 Tax=Cryoendolithus antarcticus TaxID=1507870 RepID=A0A1V8T7M9_9PEZI|nr:hypothetical protein B0A48_07110 [Cryoendolithus antarcticus]
MLHGLASAGVPSPHMAMRSPSPVPVEAYSPDAHLALRHAALGSHLQKRDQVYKGNVTLDQTFNDLTLISFQAKAGNDTTGRPSIQVTVTCEECYISGLVTAELTIDGDLDISQLVNQTLREIEGDIKEITDSFSNQTEAWLKTEVINFFDGDWKNLALPTYNGTLELPTLTPLPNTSLKFGFGGIELFLQLKTSLSQLKYQLPIVPKTAVPGFGLVVAGQDFGLYINMDLIITAGAEIDITSGVHLKIAEGAELHVDLFGSNVSKIIFNGGDFEFLPITVHTTAGSTLNATLRIGVAAGVVDNAWGTTPDWEASALHLPVFKGGIEAGVFADVAEFVLRMTETPDDPDCQLQIDQEFAFAFGASAGASVTFSTYGIGPTGTIAVPFFSTTLASECLQHRTASATPAVTSSATLAKRQDTGLSTATMLTTYTNVVCAASVTGVCPASLQSTNKAISTLSTLLPSGATATWPGVQIGSVITSAFGSNVHPMTSPSTLIPTSISSPVISDIARADSWIHKHWRTLAIGLGAGIGGLLLAIILGCCLQIRI